MSKFETIREFIDIGLALTGAVPGVTQAIMGIIALIPSQENQEWTEDKVRAYVQDFRSRQAEILEEFNNRRHDEPEPQPEPEAPEAEPEEPQAEPEPEIKDNDEEES